MNERPDFLGDASAEDSDKAAGRATVWNGKERRMKHPVFLRNRRWYETMDSAALDARIKEIVKEVKG